MSHLDDDMEAMRAQLDALRARNLELHTCVRHVYEQAADGLPLWCVLDEVCRCLRLPNVFQHARELVGAAASNDTYEGQ